MALSGSAQDGKGGKRLKGVKGGILKAYHGKYCQKKKHIYIYIVYDVFVCTAFFSGNVILNHSLMLVQTTDVATLGADMKFHLSHISGKVNTTAKRTLSIVHQVCLAAIL